MLEKIGNLLCPFCTNTDDFPPRHGGHLLDLMPVCQRHRLLRGERYTQSEQPTRERLLSRLLKLPVNALPSLTADPGRGHQLFRRQQQPIQQIPH
ncbi:hypothetical protein D3C78_1236690 [compost metagenome]